MLLHIHMDVHLPAGMPADVINEIRAHERAYLQGLQHSSKWRHIWHLVGEYANVSVFDIQSNAEPHDILTALPLFPCMEVSVTPLCRHPSSVHSDDA